MTNTGRGKKLCINLSEDDGLINFLISQNLTFTFERYVHKQGLLRKPIRGMYIMYREGEPVREAIERYMHQSVIAFATV